MSLARRRPGTIALVALVVVAVAVAAVLLARGGGDEGPTFRAGDGMSGFRDADGLLRGVRLAPARVGPLDDDSEPPIVWFTGPGSRSFDFVAVVLPADAHAMRIRQVTKRDAQVTNGKDAVDWRAYVAPQYRPNPKQIVNRVGPWRPVGREGALVRPGQEVRLRTRFTAGPTTGHCHTIVFEDAPLWLERRDGSDEPWHRMRLRDDGGDEAVRTGAHGLVGFHSGSKDCAGDGVDNGDATTLLPDAGVDDDGELRVR